MKLSDKTLQIVGALYFCFALTLALVSISAGWLLVFFIHLLPIFIYLGWLPTIMAYRRRMQWGWVLVANIVLPNIAAFAGGIAIGLALMLLTGDVRAVSDKGLELIGYVVGWSTWLGLIIWVSRTPLPPKLEAAGA